MKTSLKSILAVGFACIILSLISIIGFWLTGINRNLDAMQSAVGELLESQEVFIMRDSALRRVIALFRMSGTDDPFQRDEYYLKSKELAQDFIRARDKLLTGNFFDWELSTWESAQPHIREGYRIQTEIINLMVDDKMEEALELLQNKGVVTQERVMQELTILLNSQTQAALKTFIETDQRNKLTLWLVSAFGAFAIISSILVAIFILRRAGEIESALVNQAERIRLLYEISSTSGISYEETVTRMLEVGCGLFGTEIGEVCRIDNNKQTAKLMSSYVPPDVKISSGDELDLKGQFFEQLLNPEGMVSTDANVVDDRFYATNYGITGIRTYLSAPIKVNDNLFGMVNFISRDSRDDEFSEMDKDLLKLISNWMSVTCEKQQSNQELSESRDIAERANKSKSTFLANMSHEIRTPLTTIIGFSETLLNNNITDKTHDQSVETIIRSGKHLQHVINDILDLSKIEAGELEVEKIEVSPVSLIREIYNIIEVQTKEKGLGCTVVYDYPLPETIVSDPTRLKQILINLCSNAIKFTDNGSITITVSCDRMKSRLVVSVADTGVGMTKKERENLFMPFRQADSTITRKFGGTGLGLCISKQLTEKLGGTITCLSQKGLGSKFTVVVDSGDISNVEWVESEKEQMSEQYETEILTTPDSPPALSGKILLAEDTKDIQQLISLYVKNTGASISVVDNGELAVERAMSSEYDLVLLDMQMPVMGGLEATNKLRQAGYKKPLVALTASAMKEDREKCFAAGVDDYLVKPIDPGRFYSVLKQYLSMNDNLVHHPESECIINDFGSDPEYIKLVQMFMETLPGLVIEIKQAAFEKRWDDAGFAAHKLKGSGGGFGFSELSDLAGVIQNKIMEKEYPAVMEYIHRLMELSNTLIAQSAQKKVV